jgi:hypothetical protein
MNMKKTVFLLLTVVLFAFSVMSVDEAQATTAKYKCYKLYYNSDCLDTGITDYKTWAYTYVGLYTNPPGLYYDINCDCYGSWVTWGGSMTILYDNTGGTFLSGSKKQGFYIYSNGSWNINSYLPGCWYLQNVSCKTIVSTVDMDNPDHAKSRNTNPGMCLQ